MTGLANSFHCAHGSDAPEPVLLNLPESQAGAARHKCAVCAYSRGHSEGTQLRQLGSPVETCQHGNSAPTDILADLPESQAGPGLQRHKCCVCAYSQGLAAAALIDSPHPDEVIDAETLYEGAVNTVSVNAYERNPVARQRCVERYGPTCFICGFDFEVRYGDAGRGLIHVHHLRLLASVGVEYVVDPVNDLRPVCPNCHAIIHRKNPPYSIEEVRAMLKTA